MQWGALIRFKLYFGIFLAAVLFLAVGPGAATASVDAPGIAWQKLLGGSRSDEARSVQQTADGGYIFLGDSLSTASGGGDVTDTTNGGTYSGDFWLVKTNPTGTIQWQNLLGGSKDEDGSSVQQTADGGYVAFGSTNSNWTGDVHGTNRGSNFPDYWIVKVSGAGTIQWERLLGGSGADNGRYVQQTSDGGYILLGVSDSNPSGEVTDTRNGDEDIWVVKMNATGVIQWNQLLGGSSTEDGYSVQQTSDGEYIILGSSKSSQNGDVTGTTHGGFDFWVVKLNSSGTIQWQKQLGGSLDDFGYSVRQTADGGYILLGESHSSASGDVTDANHGAVNSIDFWVVKLNSSGAIQWQKLLGGSLDDNGRSVRQTADRGYILAGYSSSSANGNVTDTNHGSPDVWVVKLNATALPVSLVPGGNGIPTDTNGDGQYDDVNGNGRKDFADVVLYFNQMTWIAANEPATAFDYNGNGRIDFADVVWLFNHL